MYIYIYIYIYVNVAKHPKSLPTRSRAIPNTRTNSTQSCINLSFFPFSHTPHRRAQKALNMVLELCSVFSFT